MSPWLAWPAGWHLDQLRWVEHWPVLHGPTLVVDFQELEDLAAVLLGHAVPWSVYADLYSIYMEHIKTANPLPAYATMGTARPP